MVKIVFTGAGGVASSIIDILVAEKKHEILVLTRGDTSKLTARGLTAVQVEYTDKVTLIQLLKGVHTVLSFIPVHVDPDNVSQKTLIDASIEAGVKRFAPSEWAGKSNGGIPWYAGKDQVREYLEEINKDKKVLEYSLFQPGGFTDLFIFPYKVFEHLASSQYRIDFENKRAILLEGGEGKMTLTTVKDFAKVVSAALDYEGEWPIIGGINGGDRTEDEIVEIGEKVRGAKFEVERIPFEDVQAGEIHASWVPEFSHPSVPKEQWVSFAKMVTLGTLASARTNAWTVSDEWNKLLPDIKFQSPDEFLVEQWSGKP